MKKNEKSYAVDFEPTLLQELSDPKVAALYVQEFLEDSKKQRNKLLLQALMNVAKAQGISKLSKGSESKRRLIYKALSEGGNPSIATLEEILESMGLMLNVKPIKRKVI